MSMNDVIYASDYGVAPSLPTNPFYIDDALDVLIADVKAKRKRVIFTPGLYFHKRSCKWPRDVEFDFTGRNTNLRSGVSGNALTEQITKAYGAVFVACGTGPKEYTLDYVTESTQCGFDRAIPAAAQHPDNADSKFTRATLLDFTNKNASGATPATLRAFSAAHYIEEGWGRLMLRGLRAVTSCPDAAAGEVEGLGGWAKFTTIAPYADWDIGIFVSNPWSLMFEDVQTMGLWKMKGHVSYGPLIDVATYAPSGTPGNAESGLYNNVRFQCGVAFRAPDVWPVLDKTSAQLYVRWTPSHRFNPAGGVVRVSSDDTLAGTTDWEYTSITYTTSNSPTGLPGPWIRLNGAAASTGFVSVTTGRNSKLYQQFSGGHSHTIMRDSVLFDAAHPSGVDEASPDMNAAGLPGRERYTSPLEISGAPMRALKFDNVVYSPTGPIAAHVGTGFDLELNDYAEAKPYRLNLGDPLVTERSAVFIGGPRASHKDIVGSGGRFTYSRTGQGLNSNIHRAPHVYASGGRVSTWEDVHNPTFFYDESINQPMAANGGLALGTAPGGDVAISARGGDIFISRTDAAGNNSRTALAWREVSGVNRLLLAYGASPTLDIIPDIAVQPGADGTIKSGGATRRWSTIYAATGTINTSDERLKTDIEGIPDSWLDAWAEVEYVRFKMKDAVAAKGNGARWHVGIIAQRVVDAFAKHGIDAFEIGLACYDKWGDQYNEKGQLEVAAGDAYGIRYEEAAILEAALTRRTLKRYNELLTTKK